MAKNVVIIFSISILALLAGCRPAPSTPAMETVVVKETVPVRQTVLIKETVPVVKTVVVKETVPVKETVVVRETVVVKETVPVTETFVVTVTEVVVVLVTPTPEPPTPTPTVDLRHSAVDAVLNRIPMVQYLYDVETRVESFICVGNNGLNSVQGNPEGAIFVGPDSGDFSLRGINFLFELLPRGGILAAPLGREGRLINRQGEEVYRLSLGEVLTAFTTGEALWTGSLEDPGRGDCLDTFHR
jgi:hypothetical protein